LTVRPKAIVFDAVGTLIRPDPLVAVAYFEHGRRYGCPANIDEVERRFRAAFARQEEIDSRPGGLRTTEARERDRWRAIVGEVFPEAPQPAALFESLWNHFAEPRHWALYADALAGLSTLRSQGLRLAVASNFDQRLMNICRGLAPLADIPVFVSSTLGHRKPSPEFFRSIASRMGLDPRELVMVGDDPANDQQAARAVGWQAVLLDRKGGMTGKDVLARLDELPTWLGKL
jgi:putative hydrolase of the HAD superfamily